MNRFVPTEWKLTDTLRDYARKKGLTEATIDDQEEGFRLCQFPKPILDFDKAWMRWIRSAIEWGKVVPVREVTYRQPDELLPKQREADIIASIADMERYRK